MGLTATKEISKVKSDKLDQAIFEGTLTLIDGWSFLDFRKPGKIFEDLLIYLFEYIKFFEQA